MQPFVGMLARQTVNYLDRCVLPLRHLITPEGFMHYTKRQARKLLSAATDADLARFFGIHRTAVWLWPEDEPIPQARQDILARVTKADLSPNAAWRTRPDKGRS